MEAKLFTYSPFLDSIIIMIIVPLIRLAFALSNARQQFVLIDSKAHLQQLALPELDYFLQMISDKGLVVSPYELITPVSCNLPATNLLSIMSFMAFNNVIYGFRKH